MAAPFIESKMAFDKPFQHEYAYATCARQEQHHKRGPSFIMHPYAKKQATPQKSRTTKRCRGTLSGQTSVQPTKLQCQIRGKYDQGEAQKALSFISQKIGEGFSTSGDMDNFQNQLKDGVKLCKLVNALKPGSIPEKKYATPPTMSFKQMELIGLAIDKMKQLGVPDHEMFQTVDLYEAQNLHQCVIGISALARKTGAYGPKEAEANKRDFTEEQLKAGQNIIGLQMGTNKGANQSGMNIGNTRHIVD